MQLVKSRALRLLGSVLFFSYVSFAAAGNPSITGPQYNDTGSFQLSPSFPDAPYFLNEIWMSKDNSGWEPFVVSYSNVSVNVDVSAVGDYEFRTRWYNPGTQPATYSQFSNSIVVIVSAIEAPPVPAINVPTSSNNGSYVVSWGKTPRADQYKLERAFNSGAWALVQSNSSYSYNASSQAAGTYSYRVSACNATGCTVSNTSSITVTTENVPTPAMPSPTRVPNVTVITWPAVTHASYYETDIYQGSWIRISTGSSNSAWFGGYNPTQFRVRACNVNAVCSDFAYGY